MIYMFADYELDEHLYQLRRAGEIVAIEPQVFRFLAYLCPAWFAHSFDRCRRRSRERGDLWLADPHLIPAPENPAVRQRFRQLFIENHHGFLAPYYLARTPKPPALDRLSQLQARR